MSEIYTRIIGRHDTSINWQTANPILEEAEPGYDTTLKKWKVGDGSTPWNDLEWSSASYDEISTLTQTVTNHTENDSIHVTQTEKNTWDAKSDFSGSYNDLTDKPSIPVVNDAIITIVQGDTTKGSFTLNQSENATIELGEGLATVSWNDVTDKPDFATVATSGSYDDLLNKPSIPDAQVQSNWIENDSTSKAYIKNKPTLANVATSGEYSDLSGTPNLATVATSGSYNDLSNKPSIPTVNNATLTITQGGVSKGTFTANASSDVTIALDAGSGGSVSWNDVTDKPTFATVATSGSYNDLSNTPSIPAAQIQSDWNQTTDSALDYIKNKPSLANVATSGAYSDLSGTPNLATVATSGSYNDLTNTPTIPDAQVQSNWTESDNTSKAYILNKPNLATVATSGSYNDLSNTPSIPAAQVQSDWNATSGMGEILNKPNLANVATSGAYSDLSGTPNLATVATSGSYSDLTNTPTIPTVNNATLTINQGGVLKGTFTANASSDVTIDLAAGGGSVAWNDITDKPSFATVATTGSYTDLSNTPSIPAAQVNSDWDASSGVAQILNKPSLAAVATSGAYSDLSGTPNLATVATSGSYEDLTNKPTIPAAQVNSDWNSTSGASEILNKPTILTSNDFKTLNSESLVGSGDISIKSYAQNTQAVASGTTSLAPVENTVYTFAANPTALTLSSIPNSQYETDIYFTAGGNFNLVLPANTVVYGSASIVSGENYTIAIKDGKVVIAHDGITTSSVAWNDITGKPSFATVATSGSYTDLSNKPSIPAAQIQSDWTQSDNTSLDYIKNKPNLATVATSGAYSDLSGTPNLATVATSGSYSDLTNKPSIPAAQVQSDWNATTGMGEILNKPSLAAVATSGAYSDLSGTPSLATVATSGAYSDLSGTPTIPTVNNATLTITQGGTSAGTFTANASSDVTIALAAPGDANVQSNWSETNSSSDAYILNKPTMQTYEITFTLSDNTTVTKTFWVQS